MKFLVFLTLTPLLAATVNDLTINSSNFLPSDWKKSYVQIGAGAMAAPMGFTSAQSVDDIADQSYQVHMIQTASPVSFGKKGSDSASVSVFLHTGALHQVVLVNLFSSNGRTGAVTARVDLNTGFVLGTSTDCCAPFSSFSTHVTDAGGGWWRVGVSVTVPKHSQIDSVTPMLQFEQAGGGPYIDTTAQAGIMYLYGMQVDTGSSPLPYQPVP